MVQFQLEPGKPPRIFRFNVSSARALEQAGGANPAFLASSGRQVTALVLMLQYALSHDDPTMNERKAEKLVQRYLDNGGKAKTLTDALTDALMECGVYGDAGDAEGEESEADPTVARTA
jgi:hypothetical protein